MPAISVSIKTDVLMALEQAIKSTGISKSKLTEMALVRFLQEMKEDQEDYEIAAAAWEEFQKSGERTWSLDELREELNL